MVHSAYSQFLKSSADEDWERLFSDWAKPPGKTEQTRCDNAVSAIRNAVAKNLKLNHRGVKVFPQGSYRNRVNVRQDSDVDVGVLCYDSYFYRYPPGVTDAQVGNTDGPATYTFSQFKNDLEEALVNYFGPGAVTRGNKAFDVHETSYHVEADVVPVFGYRTYTASGFYIQGVALLPDNGSRITNFPERLLDWWPQVPLHYENGVSKNTATGRRFKSVVRIIKKLRNLMEEKGFSEANPIPSYLIECLAYNVSNTSYQGSSWLPTVRSVLCSIWSATKDETGCDDWNEVDEIEKLFHPSQPWTRQQAHDFVSKAWEIIDIS